MKQKYELLAPVGSFAMLQAAVQAGCDAIYFGLEAGFSMRAGSRNFKISDLDKIRKICDSSPRKPRMYLTLNTIIYDSELKQLEKLIKKVKNKVDAIICWDLSVIQLCRKYNIPFFISTQASVSNTKTAEFYKKLGAKRVILARELDLKQIKEISKIIDIEAFAHGAMCVAVSGRCFTSQFLFNKSANRGECIHPCRRSYIVKRSNQRLGIEHPSVVVQDKQEGYELELANNKVMSAKDLCTLPFIEDMKASGIRSFKIEGRNRDPRYVHTVIKIYRKALDKKLTREEIKQYMQELKDVYNRGFSSGFYLGKPTSKDFSEVEHSASKKQKHFIGKVLHYYPKIKVATIKLVSSVKLGDEIVIIGENTGVVNSVIKQMEIKKKPIKSAKKNHELGIKLDSRVRKNDEVYKLKIKN